jgi:hypothetical protein
MHSLQSTSKISYIQNNVLNNNIIYKSMKGEEYLAKQNYTITWFINANVILTY